MNAQEYVVYMLPYAQQANLGTTVAVPIILAQWALESGFGTSELAQQNNHGGITYVDESIADGPAPGGRFARYASREQFTRDYIRVMNLSYYRAVRAASATVDLYDDARALGESAYDEDGYTVNGVKGAKIMLMLDNYPVFGQADGLPAMPTSKVNIEKVLLAIAALAATALFVIGAQREPD